MTVSEKVLGRISVCCVFYKESSRSWIKCEVYSRRPLCRKFCSCFSKNLPRLYAQLWQQVDIIDIILCYLYDYDVFRQSIFKYKTSSHHLGETQFLCITFFYIFCLFAFEPGCHTVTQAGSIARYVTQAGFELTVILLIQLPSPGLMGIQHSAWLSISLFLWSK